MTHAYIYSYIHAQDASYIYTLIYMPIHKCISKYNYSYTHKSYIYIVIYRALTARFEFHRFLFKVIKKVTISSSKPLQKRNLLMQQGSQII